MPAHGHVMALDQGTTSTRAILYRTPELVPVAVAQREIAQHFPASGWVEHEPEDLWNSSVAVLREAMAGAGLNAADIAGIGIANQRETTLVWHRHTGRPIHRALVWQDRRTADACAALRRAGHAARVADATGLLIDPYFSATKIAWMLDHVPGVRAALVASVACTRPSVRRHSRKLSTVPKASSPRSAASRAPGTWSSIQAILVAEK